MRTILYITIITTFLSSCAVVKCNPDPLFITNVVEVPNASKKEIYLRAKYFIYMTYQSPINATRWDDSEFNRLSFTGKQDVDAYPNSSSYYGDVTFTIELQFKDGKCKYFMTIHNLEMKKDVYSLSCSNSSNGLRDKQWDNFRKNVQNVCQDYVITPLLKALNEPYIENF